MSKAINDVIAERHRQQAVEGWTPEHDDEHEAGALGRAGGLYALNAGAAMYFGTTDTSICDTAPSGWPWAPEWWKPTNSRRDMVKAAALILAEIERFDRLHGDRTASAAGFFDFIAHLHRQREFSERTFGPGKRVHGVTDHIAKELIEVRESDGDLNEWVDVIILGLDGAWRSGATPEQVVAAIVAKQTKNEGRTWPDWRTVPADTAIEHDRSQEAA